MQTRKSINRRRSRKLRRLTTEALESRQLMAADLGMPGSSDLQSAMLSRIQSSGVDVSAIVSRFQSSGISSQQLQAMRQQIAGNPTSQAMVQQRMQAALSQTDIKAETKKSEEFPPAALIATSVESIATQEAAVFLVDQTEQVELPSSETSPRENVRERLEDSELADTIRERVEERFDGEVPEELQERIAAGREGGTPGGPLSRIREMSDRTDVDPSQFVVRDADGGIDREATRENIRERLEDSELADTIRERVEERFDGEVPEGLQERIAAGREGGTAGGPLSRIRELADRNDVDPSQFVVRDADGGIDREATRENIRERLEDSELADTIRERVEERFDGEVPEELQERISERREVHGGDALVGSVDAELAFPVVSPLGRPDVNRDGALSALDALLVINVMNNSASGYSEMADVNADGQITPIDALQVVNALGEQAGVITPQLRVAAIDSILAGGLDDDEEEGIFSLPIRSRMRIRT